MINSKKVLAVIPARGGSKRLPGKNIRPLCGKPLIAWTIEQAKSCPCIDEVVVSTDSREIAAVSAEYGLPVPFMRPAELATDTATSVDVLFHALDYFATFDLTFNYIAMLEPTSPLRRENDLEDAITACIAAPDSDGIISLGKVHMEHPWIVKTLTSNGKIVPFIADGSTVTSRQQCSPAYFPYGVIYMVKTAVLHREKTFYTHNIIPHFLERWQNYEIDDLCDFYCIESIMQARLRGDI